MFAGYSISGFASGITRSVVNGGKVELRSIAIDAFGNALGGALVAGAKPAGQQEIERRDLLGDFITSHEQEWADKYGDPASWNFHQASPTSNERAKESGDPGGPLSVKSVQAPDGDPNKIIDPKRPGLYVVEKVLGEWTTVSARDKVETGKAAINGMLNPPSYAAWLMGQHIETQFAGTNRFTLFYNPTEGTVADGWEALQDKLGFTTDIAKQFAEVLQQTHSSGRQVDLGRP